MRAIIGIGALAVALAMLSGTARAETYRIDHEVWGWYQKYLRNIGNGTKPGAFAITKDGQGAYYSWCQDIRCVAGTTYSHDAVSACERHFETDCVVFAVRDDIRVEYEIIGGAPGASADVAALAPAPVTRIAVAPDVQADIDVYLRNTQSSARAWALAIAKDGSSVHSAACSTSNNFAVPTCDPSQGSAQELAKRNAVKQCGGAAACVLLYVGNVKAGNIEIVAAPGAGSPSAAAPATNPPAKTPAPSTTLSTGAPAAVAGAEPAPEPAPAPTPPPPAIKLSVTPAVQEKIDVYLRNAQSSGRAWAFAIAKDGSDGAMASCAGGSTYAGGRSCYPVLGSKEELAKREALTRCGGPAECLVLYVGQQKQGNFEIIVR